MGWLALPVWVVLTATLYLLAVRRVAPLPYSLSNPAAHANALIGQNGLLTTGIFLLGSGGINARPFVSGLTLGLLVIKPQLGILLPFALVAGRAWTAAAGAAVSAIGLLLLAWLAFGWEAYRGFLDILPSYAAALQNSRWPWNELASPFAFFRYFAVPQSMALVLHGLIAVAAIAITVRAWSRNAPQRFAILATATVLMAPYLLTYDTLLLTVPLALFIRQSRAWLSGFLWLCLLLGFASYTPVYAGPNMVPIAAIVALWVLAREQPVPRQALQAG
jgi:hypothetical protein